METRWPHIVVGMLVLPALVACGAGSRSHPSDEPNGGGDLTMDEPGLDPVVEDGSPEEGTDESITVGEPELTDDELATSNDDDESDTAGDDDDDGTTPPGVTPQGVLDCEAMGCTCYALRAHGESVPGDESPFVVLPGESYSEFSFSLPWDEPSVIVGYRGLSDEPGVAYRAWVSTTSVARPDFAVERNALGTLLGEQAVLVAAWTAGRGPVVLPEGTALDVEGQSLVLQWHHYNDTGMEVEDRSGVELCVVPRSSIDPGRLADITLLGTEDLGGLEGMGPGFQSFDGTCTPGRAGLEPDAPITVVGWLPLMNDIGIHMTTTRSTTSGIEEVIFEQPYDPATSWSLADPAVVLRAGDTLTTECIYDNGTGRAVSFGESRNQEICFLLAFSFPAGALRSSAPSLIGNDNVCWTFGD